MTKDLGQKIDWFTMLKFPRAIVYCIYEIRFLRENQLKPGIINALAKLNQT